VCLQLTVCVCVGVCACASVIYCIINDEPRCKVENGSILKQLTKLRNEVSVCMCVCVCVTHALSVLLYYI